MQPIGHMTFFVVLCLPEHKTERESGVSEGALCEQTKIILSTEGRRRSFLSFLLFPLGLLHVPFFPLCGSVQLCAWDCVVSMGKEKRGMGWKRPGCRLARNHHNNGWLTEARFEEEEDVKSVLCWLCCVGCVGLGCSPNQAKLEAGSGAREIDRLLLLARVSQLVRVD
jgi:hypothetical protein